MRFKQWLESSGLKKTTADKYSNATANTLSQLANKENIFSGKLSCITNPQQFLTISLRIQALPKFQEMNNTGNHMYSCALDKHFRYLLEKSKHIENDLEKIITDTNLNETEKTAQVNQRIGQGKFRDDLIKYWGACSVTGYTNTDLTIASHIKPWFLSSNEERLDIFNGLLLIPNLDRAFDKGFITFSTSGKIMISSGLQKPEFLGIQNDMRVPLTEEHAPYMTYHRENIFLSA